MSDLNKFCSEVFEILRSSLSLTNKKDSALLHGRPISSGNLNIEMSKSDALGDLQFGYRIRKVDSEVAHAFKTYATGRLKEENRDSKLRRQDLSEDLQRYSIGLDIVTGEGHVLKDGALYSIDYEAWYEGLSEEDKEVLALDIVRMSVRFDPHRELHWMGTFRTRTNTEPLKYYNAYSTPEWVRRGPPKDLCIEKHKKYTMEYFKSFLPVKSERMYVINWINLLKSQRMDDMLVFVGNPGNGKNTFMRICETIVGKENRVFASSKFGEKEFNTELKNRKLVCLDEAELIGVKKEAYKKWINDQIPIEAKGKDPMDIENHASFIFASNKYKVVHLEHLDRKFSVPELGKRKLADVFGVEGNEDFQSWILTEEFALTFPYFISFMVENMFNGATENDIQEYDKHTRLRVIKGDAFYRQVERSKTDWFKGMKQLLTQQSFLELKDIKRLIKGIGHDKIKETLDIETEERRDRGIEPHEICKVNIDLDGIRYVSNIHEEVVTADADSL